jgi:hypothetical protein
VRIAGAGGYDAGMIDPETYWFMLKVKLCLLGALIAGVFVCYVVWIYGWAFFHLFTD